VKNQVDALEILVLANALALVVAGVAFSRPLHRMLRAPKLKFKFRNRYAIAIVLAVVMITSVSAVTLLQHNFPATPTGSSQAITSTCTTLALETTGMITGLPENMLFSCGPTTAAITSSSGGTSTPTFTLPAGATSLSLLSHVNNAVVCTPASGSALTSGASHSFTAGESLDYCLASNSYPNNGIASFTVTWSQ
jgi:hypothetical protein